MRRQVFGPAHVALAQLQSRAGKRSWQLRLFEDGARGRQQQAHSASSEFFERFDALARYFCMRLDFTEAFARRIERDGDVVYECFQVRKPAFGFSHLVGDNDNESVWLRASQRGDEHRVAAAGEATNAQGRPGPWELTRDARKRRKRLEGVEQSWKAHLLLAFKQHNAISYQRPDHSHTQHAWHHATRGAVTRE
jgi:hypothetical protein